MKNLLSKATFPRRELLKAGGALVIGFSLNSVRAQAPLGVAITPAPDQPDPALLDTWIAIHADNTATVFFGFAELGQGNSTALLQIAAEELDFEITQVRAQQLETRISPNQGGTVASASVPLGGPRIRQAAAQARAVLLERAAIELGASADRLQVTRGVVAVAGDPARTVSYGALLGDKPFDLAFSDAAAPKSPDEYKTVGVSIPRNDIPAKAGGTYVHMQHMRVPNMLHGRVVRPRGQRAYGEGARVLRVDAESIADIPGAQLVQRGDFLGVVAQLEWDAIRAAQQVDVTWSPAPTLPGSDGIHAQMRSSETSDRVVLETGDIDSALEHAEHTVSNAFKGPYQAHAPFAPNCAIANVSNDSVDVMCSTQNIYEARAKVATVLGRPVEDVSVRYYESSGTFGHSCYDDAAQAAALLSAAVRQPVRLQFMRWDEHGWDNYGPAQLAEVSAGVDRDGKLVGYQFDAWQHDWMITETSEQLALGTPAAESSGPVAQELSALNAGSMYSIENRKLVNHRVDGVNGYLKGSYLRSPLDTCIAFASEQTIDELAYLSDADPHEFRQRNTDNPRWLGVLNAVADAANWQPRRAATALTNERIVRGRGIALGTHLSSFAAAVAEIQVDTETGKITAKHMYGALDAGLAVNPGFLENQITGMLVQATSRMLKEQVAFDHTNVTSLDWVSYPILRFEECPEVTPIVVQRRDQPSSGGGEEVLSPAAAAIANALFDATGIRLREYPLTPERVLAAISQV